ncbi:hypothetical protein [uncultured Roseibium sp.]|uniref:hypothetical protein n=1 Tax=uncultured Roseibium sp. TaxID=1936171 RepID=UPI00261AF411|nr:hypothetical protein [uncultured Roseibium sp.]
MMVGFFAGTVLYGTVTLLFLIVSSAELLGNRLSTPGRLLGVLVTSVFWPITLVVLGVTSLATMLNKQLKSVEWQGPFGASQKLN